MDHLPDIEADFLRFYGVYEPLKMESAKFFRLAYRLFAYEGVMSMRVRQERNKPKAVTTEDVNKRGGEGVAVTTDQPSYLAQRLKEGE